MMLTLTESAVNKVKAVLADQPDSDGYQGIRVAVVGGGCSGFQYSLSLEKGGNSDDQVLDSSDFKIFVDEQSSIYLEGTQIDYIETSQGAGFKFDNPNVKSSCGCGESFQA